MASAVTSPAATPRKSPLLSSSFGPAVSSSLPPTDITLAGIMTELSLCHHRSQQVQSQLQQLAQQHKQTTDLIQPSLASLHTALPAVTAVSTQLSSILNSSALSASQLSSQVRSLDTTQSRVLAALRRVSQLLDVRDTITLVDKERREGKWELAVKELHRVLYCQRTIDDSNYSRLRQLEDECRQEVTRLMQEKEERKEWREVLSFARLLPYVDRTFVGLSSYCHALRRLFAAQLTSKSLTLSTQPPSAVIPFPHLLSSILDQAAATLKTGIPATQHAFGPGSHLRLLQDVQAACDEEVSPLLRQFVVDKGVNGLVREAKVAQSRMATARKAAAAAAGSGGGSAVKAGVEVSEVDVRALDALLTEIAFLSRETDLFDSNMRTLAKQAEDARQKGIEHEAHQLHQLQQPNADDTAPPTSPSSSTSAPSSAHSKLVLYYNLAGVYTAMSSSPYTAHLKLSSAMKETAQELLGQYIALEEHYMLVNVDKAMRIDVHEGEEVEEDEDEEKEDEERQRRDKEREAGGVSRVQAISDKFTQNITSNISNLNLAIQASSGIGIPITAPTAASTSAAPVAASSATSIAPAFLRRFRVTLTSTVVDDVFFILKKCTERAFSTFSAQAACALVNHINSLLEREYHDSLEAVFVDYERRYTPSQKKPVFLPATSNESSRASGLVQLLTSAAQTGQMANVQQRKASDDSRLLVTVNNLQVSVEHVAVLRQHLTAEFDDMYKSDPAANQQKRDMMRACLDELQHTQGKLSALHGRAVQLLVNVLTVCLKAHLSLYASTSYEMSEHEYIEREHNDVYVAALTDAIGRDILPLRVALTDRNFTTLLSHLLAYLAGKLELLTSRKRFTLWGALQLDRDVRALTSFMSAVRGSEDVGVRERLMRMAQVCQVLGVEKVSEMREMWGEGGEGGMWRLHEGEVRKVLALRTEFTAKDIAALTL